MRGRIFGFALLTLALFLMLSALVVFTGESPAPPPAPNVRASVLAMPPSPLQAETSAPKAEPNHAQPALLPDARVPLVPSADANGTPVVRASYIRANYVAFHLPDRAG